MDHRATRQIEIPITTDPLVYDDGKVRISGTWAVPQTEPRAPEMQCWVHRDRTKRPDVLAGYEGRTVADTYSAPGLELTREVWIADDDGSIAIRQRLRNRSAAPICVRSLIPLRCDGPQSLLVAKRGAEAWQVVVQRRLKNGVPTAFRPGVFDKDYALATGKIVETGQGTEDEHSDRVEADPFCLIRAHDAPSSPVLLIGYLSQTGHLARLLLHIASTGRDVQLDSLVAECEFDSTVLPVGGERTSQWLLIQSGTEPNELVADYAERVGRYHGVKPPPLPAPAVMCTWYYYGPYFTEADLIEDLAYLEQDRIPFDVFLIDECWDMSWGDWEGSAEWPSGMKAAADRIRALGYRPGIWTCPLLAKIDSRLALEHSEWLLRRDDGTPSVFNMDGPNYVLDPTVPGVCQHIEELFRKMTNVWGFTYHKLDFTRAIFVDEQVQFYEPGATRLATYRQALEAVRRGAGPDAYISVCGGHYGGSLGLADSQRSGSDVVACWNSPPALPKFKQNVLRTWMNRLWHVDADAMMVRRREEPINDTRHGILSVGRFTDEEAKTIAVNQYIGGGMVCLTEKFLELDTDRKALYRHVIPPARCSSIPLDPFEPVCPSQMLTRIQPKCIDLGTWVTVAAVNWTDEPREISIELSKSVCSSLQTDCCLAFDFWSQQVLGLVETGAVLDLGTLAPHTNRLIRLAPWDGTTAVLAGTDLHFSGGGVEVSRWQVTANGVEGEVDTHWPLPVRLTVAFPSKEGYVTAQTTVEPGKRTFCIERPGGQP